MTTILSLWAAKVKVVLIDKNILRDIKNLFGHDTTNRTKENHLAGSPLFVFYPGKAVFGVVIP